MKLSRIVATAAVVLSLSSGTANALLIAVDVGIVGDVYGAGTGTIVGSGSGTFDNVSGLLTFNADVTVVTGGVFPVDVTTNSDLSTTITPPSSPGERVINSCVNNGASFDACIVLPLGVPTAMTFEGSIDANGNGILTTFEAFATPAGEFFNDTVWTVSAVPEPGWLFASGLGLLGLLRRRSGGSE